MAKTRQTLKTQQSHPTRQKTSSKKPSGRATSKTAGRKEAVIVASKMKDAIRNAGCNVAGDAIDFLNEKVHSMITAAVERAQENGRKTVRGYDF